MTTTVDRIGDLIDRGASTGVSLLRSIARSPMLPRLRSCSCEIPPPCWLPRDLGTVTTHVCAGGSATLRLRITNCGPTTRSIEVDAAGGVTLSPAKATLQPFERVDVLATVAHPGPEQEHLVWVRGCYDHVVRWSIRVSSRGRVSTCHEIDVEDCPDYVHHWYDHFYCERPCLHRG